MFMKDGLDRKKCKAKFITGHNYLNRHQFLIYGPEDEEVDPKCDRCDFNYDQTSQHIIGECPAFLGPRLDVFSLHVMEPPFNFPIESIMRFLRLVEIDALNMAEESKGANQTS